MVDGEGEEQPEKAKETLARLHDLVGRFEARLGTDDGTPRRRPLDVQLDALAERLGAVEGAIGAESERVEYAILHLDDVATRLATNLTAAEALAGAGGELEQRLRRLEEAVAAAPTVAAPPPIDEQALAATIARAVVAAAPTAAAAPAIDEQALAAAVAARLPVGGDGAIDADALARAVAARLADARPFAEQGELVGTTNQLLADHLAGVAEREVAMASALDALTAQLNTFTGAVTAEVRERAGAPDSQTAAALAEAREAVRALESRVDALRGDIGAALRTQPPGGVGAAVEAAVATGLAELHTSLGLAIEDVRATVAAALQGTDDAAAARLDAVRAALVADVAERVERLSSSVDAARVADAEARADLVAALDATREGEDARLAALAAAIEGATAQQTDRLDRVAGEVRAALDAAGDATGARLDDLRAAVDRGVREAVGNEVQSALTLTATELRAQLDAVSESVRSAPDALAERVRAALDERVAALAELPAHLEELRSRVEAVGAAAQAALDRPDPLPFPPAPAGPDPELVRALELLERAAARSESSDGELAALRALLERTEEAVGALRTRGGPSDDDVARLEASSTAAVEALGAIRGEFGALATSLRAIEESSAAATAGAAALDDALAGQAAQGAAVRAALDELLARTASTDGLRVAVETLRSDLALGGLAPDAVLGAIGELRGTVEEVQRGMASLASTSALDALPARLSASLRDEGGIASGDDIAAVQGALDELRAAVADAARPAAEEGIEALRDAVAALGERAATAEAVAELRARIDTVAAIGEASAGWLAALAELRDELPAIAAAARASATAEAVTDLRDRLDLVAAHAEAAGSAAPAVAEQLAAAGLRLDALAERLAPLDALAPLAEADLEAVLALPGAVEGLGVSLVRTASNQRAVLDAVRDLRDELRPGGEGAEHPAAAELRAFLAPLTQLGEAFSGLAARPEPVTVHELDALHAAVAEVRAAVADLAATPQRPVGPSEDLGALVQAVEQLAARPAPATPGDLAAIRDVLRELGDRPLATSGDLVPLRDALAVVAAQAAPAPAVDAVLAELRAGLEAVRDAVGELAARTGTPDPEALRRALDGLPVADDVAALAEQLDAVRAGLRIEELRTAVDGLATADELEATREELRALRTRLDAVAAAAEQAAAPDAAGELRDALEHALAELRAVRARVEAVPTSDDVVALAGGGEQAAVAGLAEHVGRLVARDVPALAEAVHQLAPAAAVDALRVAVDDLGAELRAVVEERTRSLATAEAVTAAAERLAAVPTAADLADVRHVVDRIAIEDLPTLRAAVDRIADAELANLRHDLERTLGAVDLAGLRSVVERIAASQDRSADVTELQRARADTIAENLAALRAELAERHAAEAVRGVAGPVGAAEQVELVRRLALLPTAEELQGIHAALEGLGAGIARREDVLAVQAVLAGLASGAELAAVRHAVEALPTSEAADEARERAVRTLVDRLDRLVVDELGGLRIAITERFDQLRTDDIAALRASLVERLDRLATADLRALRERLDLLAGRELDALRTSLLAGIGELGAEQGVQLRAAIDEALARLAADDLGHLRTEVQRLATDGPAGLAAVRDRLDGLAGAAALTSLAERIAELAPVVHAVDRAVAPLPERLATLASLDDVAALADRLPADALTALARAGAPDAALARLEERLTTLAQRLDALASAAQVEQLHAAVTDEVAEQAAASRAALAEVSAAVAAAQAALATTVEHAAAGLARQQAVDALAEPLGAVRNAVARLDGVARIDDVDALREELARLSGTGLEGLRAAIAQLPTTTDLASVRAGVDALVASSDAATAGTERLGAAVRELRDALDAVTAERLAALDQILTAVAADSAAGRSDLEALRALVGTLVARPGGLTTADLQLALAGTASADALAAVRAELDGLARADDLRLAHQAVDLLATAELPLLLARLDALARAEDVAALTARAAELASREDVAGLRAAVAGLAGAEDVRALHERLAGLGPVTQQALEALTSELPALARSIEAAATTDDVLALANRLERRGDLAAAGDLSALGDRLLRRLDLLAPSGTDALRERLERLATEDIGALRAALDTLAETASGLSGLGARLDGVASAEAVAALADRLVDTAQAADVVDLAARLDAVASTAELRRAVEDVVAAAAGRDQVDQVLTRLGSLAASADLVDLRERLDRVAGPADLAALADAVTAVSAPGALPRAVVDALGASGALDDLARRLDRVATADDVAGLAGKVDALAADDSAGTAAVRAEAAANRAAAGLAGVVERLDAVATAALVDDLARRLDALDSVASADAVAAVADRLDRLAELDRLAGREDLAALASGLDRLATAEAVQALAIRLDGLATAEAVGAVAERLDAVGAAPGAAEAVERAFASLALGDQFGRIADALAAAARAEQVDDLRVAVDALAATAADAVPTAQLDALRQRLDRLAEVPAELDALQRAVAGTAAADDLARVQAAVEGLATADAVAALRATLGTARSEEELAAVTARVDERADALAARLDALDPARPLAEVRRALAGLAAADDVAALHGGLERIEVATGTAVDELQRALADLRALPGLDEVARRLDGLPGADRLDAIEDALRALADGPLAEVRSRLAGLDGAVTPLADRVAAAASRSDVQEVSRAVEQVVTAELASLALRLEVVTTEVRAAVATATPPLPVDLAPVTAALAALATGDDLAAVAASLEDAVAAVRAELTGGPVPATAADVEVLTQAVRDALTARRDVVTRMDLEPLTAAVVDLRASVAEREGVAQVLAVLGSVQAAIAGATDAAATQAAVEQLAGAVADLGRRPLAIVADMAAVRDALAPLSDLAELADLPASTAGMARALDELVARLDPLRERLDALAATDPATAGDVRAEGNRVADEVRGLAGSLQALADRLPAAGALAGLQEAVAALVGAADATPAALEAVRDQLAPLTAALPALRQVAAREPVGPDELARVVDEATGRVAADVDRLHDAVERLAAAGGAPATAAAPALDGMVEAVSAGVGDHLQPALAALRWELEAIERRLGEQVDAVGGLAASTDAVAVQLGEVATGVDRTGRGSEVLTDEIAAVRADLLRVRAAVDALVDASELLGAEREAVDELGAQVDAVGQLVHHALRSVQRIEDGTVGPPPSGDRARASIRTAVEELRAARRRRTGTSASPTDN